VSVNRATSHAGFGGDGADAGVRVVGQGPACGVEDPRSVQRRVAALPALGGLLADTLCSLILMATRNTLTH
jgi:hypothetical protein